MISFRLEDLSVQTQEDLLQALQEEKVEYFEGTSYELYMRDSIENIIQNADHSQEFIDKYIDQTRSTVQELVDKGYIQDKELHDEIAYVVDTNLNAYFVIDNGEIGELRQLVNIITESGYEDCREYESDKFRVQTNSDGIVSYVRKYHGLLDNRIIEGVLACTNL